MQRNVVATVTVEEREEIKALFKRKVALKELVYSLAALSLAEMGPLYGRLVEDMAETCFQFDRWWAAARDKYGWAMGVRAEIDFSSGEVWTA